MTSCVFPIGYHVAQILSCTHFETVVYIIIELIGMLWIAYFSTPRSLRRRLATRLKVRVGSSILKAFFTVLYPRSRKVCWVLEEVQSTPSAAGRRRIHHPQRGAVLDVRDCRRTRPGDSQWWAATVGVVERSWHVDTNWHAPTRQSKRDNDGKSDRWG